MFLYSFYALKSMFINIHSSILKLNGFIRSLLNYKKIVYGHLIKLRNNYANSDLYDRGALSR